MKDTNIENTCYMSAYTKHKVKIFKYNYCCNSIYKDIRSNDILSEKYISYIIFKLPGYPNPKSNTEG